jgi:hypothetical protein
MDVRRVGDMVNATTSPVYTNATTSLVVSMITNATSLVNLTNSTNVTSAGEDPNLAAVMYLLGYGGSGGVNPWIVVGVVVSVLLLAIGVFLTIHFVRLKRWEDSYKTTTMLMGSASWAPPPLVPLPPRPSMPLMPSSASVRGGSGRGVKI